MFYCKSINTEDANDWDWNKSLNFKSESYVSCKLKDCNLQLTIREVLWRGLWFRFSGSLHNNKSWKAIVLTAAYSYNRGLTILTVWLFSYVVNTTDNKWIYFDKKIKINIYKIEYLDIVPISDMINFHITEIFQFIKVHRFVRNKKNNHPLNKKNCTWHDIAYHTKRWKNSNHATPCKL